MASDWLKMRQNQLGAKQSRQDQEAGQWGVPAGDMYLVLVLYLFWHRTDQVYLILPRKTFLCFFVYQYILNR